MSSYTAIVPDPQVLDVKDPDEIIFVNFDFTRDLAAGETISSVALSPVSVTVAAGTDDAASAIASGAATQVGSTNVVTQKIVGGLDGVDYRLECRVNTSASRRLAIVCILPVREL